MTLSILLLLLLLWLSIIIFSSKIYELAKRQNKTLPEPDWAAINIRYSGIEQKIRSKELNFNGVVKYCLQNISDATSLKDKNNGQRFYIGFEKDFAGVEIPMKVREHNFKEETSAIVLQNQFKILLMEDRRFTVDLLFNNKHHEIIIPFDAIRIFSDPSVGFAISRRSAEIW